MVQDCAACILNLSENMAYTREKRNACRVSDGKPDAKRPLERHRHTHDDNIKMDVK
jgi:hypothetical protein